MTLPSHDHLRVHQYRSLFPGPRLIILGAVHGNEVCGTRAIEALIRELDDGTVQLRCGSLTLVPVTNPMAYRLGRREGDRNLNRNLAPTEAPTDNESRIANVLCPLLAQHDVLLDLHSFRSPGQPFVVLGPRDNQGRLEPFHHSQAESRLAAHLGPRRMLEGWMTAYDRGVARRRARGRTDVPEVLLDTRYGVGTTEYMRSCGGYAVTLECGQHDDPRAPEVASRAIHQTLALLGLIDAPLEPPAENFEILQLVDVIDRDDAGDQFSRTWSSFDPVAEGELIGLRANGTEVRAPHAGYIVFPNAGAAPGAEWFYLAKVSDRQLPL
jgi:predicted deacylase